MIISSILYCIKLFEFIYRGYNHIEINHYKTRGNYDKGASLGVVGNLGREGALVEKLMLEHCVPTTTLLGST